MKFDLRLLTIITILITVISLLAFAQVPSDVKDTGTHHRDTLSPNPILGFISPNVQSGKKVFSFFDSSVNYQVYLPEEYSSTPHRYPVVYLLNGPVFSPDPESLEDWKVDELKKSYSLIVPINLHEFEFFLNKLENKHTHLS
ncbi:MAG: hypothetical protein EOO01_33885, partial [Chitinophagaceae bacterium]